MSKTVFMPTLPPRTQSGIEATITMPRANGIFSTRAIILPNGEDSSRPMIPLISITKMLTVLTSIATVAMIL